MEIIVESLGGVQFEVKARQAHTVFAISQRKIMDMTRG